MEYGSGAFLTPDQIKGLFRGKERVAIEAMVEIFGDSVDDTLNALHSMACRIAIASECDPKAFAEGLRHHWQLVADFLKTYEAGRHERP